MGLGAYFTMQASMMLIGVSHRLAITIFWVFGSFSPPRRNDSSSYCISPDFYLGASIDLELAINGGHQP